MHLCIGLVGISYSESYDHRKLTHPIIIDMEYLFSNHKKYLYDDLLSKGHTFDIVLSTNESIKYNTFISRLSPVATDTTGRCHLERLEFVTKYCHQHKESYDGCILMRCDLLLKSYVSFMPINYTKFNFAHRQVMYERWKQLKFKRIPTFNIHEVSDSFYFVPRSLFDTATNAFNSSIKNNQVHRVNDYIQDSDISFISNLRFQSNTDVMQNPLYMIQRSSSNPEMNPNVSNGRFCQDMTASYKSLNNYNPEITKLRNIMFKRIQIMHN